MFATQSDAKRFFVEKVVAQAAAEGTPLSDGERWMLSFSESDPDFVVDPARVAQVEAEIPDDEYEAKIGGLLRRSYHRDTDSTDSARELYGDACAKLNEGDHYLSIMIERAIGCELGSRNASTPIRILARAGLFLVLVVPGTAAILMAVGLALTFVAEQARPIGDFAPIVLGSLFLGAAGTYLIRIWLRERRG